MTARHTEWLLTMVGAIKAVIESLRFLAQVGLKIVAQLDIISQGEMPTRGSKATRSESRNRRVYFFGLN